MGNGFVGDVWALAGAATAAAVVLALRAARAGWNR